MAVGKKTIRRMVLIPGLFLLIVESVIFYFFMASNGYEEKAGENAKEAFSVAVDGSAGLLQNKMSEQWADVDDFTKDINDKTAEYLKTHGIGYNELCEDEKYASEFLSNVGTYLIETIGENQVDGSFMVLCSGVEAAHPYKEREYLGMYLRSQGENGEIVLEQGNETIARELRIDRSVNWMESFRYMPQEGESNYFLRPMMEAYSYRNLEMTDLGCWSGPFLAKETDTEMVITYALPLIAEDKTIYGVAGVEISLDNLQKNLKGSKKDMEYALICYEKDKNSEADITCSLATPITGGKVLDELNLSLSEKEDKLYTADISKNGENQAAQIRNMELYPAFSPYINERWAVLGIMDAGELSGGYTNMLLKFLIGTVCLLIVDMLFIWILVRKFIVPINRLRNQMEAGNGLQPLEKGHDSYYEFEQLEKIIWKRESLFQEVQKKHNSETCRYLMALEKVAETVFEYDCEEDIFYKYSIMRTDENMPRAKEIRIEHFMRDLESKQYCRREDVLSMTKLLKGHADEKIEVKLMSENKRNLVWSSIQGNALQDEDGRVVKVIGTIQDIHQRKNQELEQEEAGRLDMTTGLLSRETGETRIREYLFTKDKNESISLCIMDLDDFSAVNEYYGLIYGDILLEEVGAILKRYLYDGNIGVRLGGDEFLIFMKNISKEETMRICNSICSNIENMYVGYGKIQKLTCSIGFVHRNGFVDYNNLIRYAGSAMCEVKMQGKGRVEEYFGLYAKKGNALGRVEFGRDRFINKIESMQGSDNIVSVAFNIFERSVDFKSALQMLLKKIGREYGLSREILTITDEKKKENLVGEQWSMFGLEPVKEEGISYTDEECRELKELFEENGTLTIRRNTEKAFSQTVTKMLYFSDMYETLYCALYNDGKYMGNILFRKSKENVVWSQYEMKGLRAVANLISIHYANYIQQKEKEQYKQKERELWESLEAELTQEQNSGLNEKAVSKINELIQLHKL